MVRKSPIIVLVILLLGIAVLVWLSLSRQGQTPASTPIGNSLSDITSDIRQHASASLTIKTIASSTSFWVTQDGYMAIVPNQTDLESFIDSPSDINGLMSDDEALTEYASSRLNDAGYKPDPDNSSTSTNNGPFYTLRLAFVSSDGASRCLIEPPDPTQSQIQISWSFTCISTQDLSEAIQNEMPFLRALGNLKGAAVTSVQQGNIAVVGVSGEVLGYFRAIMMRKGEEWTVIYKGQADPSCSLMQEYDIPQSIYGVCS